MSSPYFDPRLEVVAQVLDQQRLHLGEYVASSGHSGRERVQWAEDARQILTASLEKITAGEVYNLDDKELREVEFHLHRALQLHQAKNHGHYPHVLEGRDRFNPAKRLEHRRRGQELKRDFESLRESVDWFVDNFGSRSLSRPDANLTLKLAEQLGARPELSDLGAVEAAESEASALERGRLEESVSARSFED